MTQPNSRCPEPAADVGEAVVELIAMLSAAGNEDGLTVFDHTPEEIGLHVMENHIAIRAALTEPRAIIRELLALTRDLGHDGGSEPCRKARAFLGETA